MSPANILNLPLYVVTGIDENDHDYRITVTVNNTPSSCTCSFQGAIRGFGRCEQLVKALPMHGKRVGIYVDTRRYQRLSESLPDVDER